MRLFGWASPAEVESLEALYQEGRNSYYKVKQDLEALNDSYRILRKAGIEERNRLRAQIDSLRRTSEYWSGLYNKVSEELSKLKAGPSPRSEMAKALDDLENLEIQRDAALNLATSCEDTLKQIASWSSAHYEQIQDAITKYRTSQT